MRVLLAAVVVAGACWTGPDYTAVEPAIAPKPAQREPLQLRVKLERTQCFGTCPAYTVVLYGSGRVEWMGHASVDALGYSALHMLGYRDSGMPDTEENKRPDNFANAPLEEAVGRFVRIIRAERPQVIITYRDEQNFYPHPDHIRVHEISGPAFDAAGDPDAYPDAGDPWQPSKLYYVSWSIARVKALHQAYLDRGEESAYTSWFGFRGSDQQKLGKELSGGERNRLHLAMTLKAGGNLLLLDEPTNDLDVDTLRALEEALLSYAGCAVVISHDRWFLDRIATHMLAFEGDSEVVWFEGNYQDYEADRKRRLGAEADQPHRIKYRKLTLS